jgi:hypothetical protein
MVYPANVSPLANGMRGYYRRKRDLSSRQPSFPPELPPLGVPCDLIR